MTTPRMTKEEHEEEVALAEKAKAVGKRLREEVRAWMVDWWGKQCSDTIEGCPYCEAWDAFSKVFKHLED